jgi:hypothetical protein
VHHGRPHASHSSSRRGILNRSHRIRSCPPWWISRDSVAMRRRQPSPARFRVPFRIQSESSLATSVLGALGLLGLLVAPACRESGNDCMEPRSLSRHAQSESDAGSAGDESSAGAAGDDAAGGASGGEMSAGTTSNDGPTNGSGGSRPSGSGGTGNSETGSGGGGGSAGYGGKWSGGTGGSAGKSGLVSPYTGC